MHLIISRLRFTHSNDSYYVEAQDKDEAIAHKKKQALQYWHRFKNMFFAAQPFWWTLCFLKAISHHDKDFLCNCKLKSKK